MPEKLPDSLKKISEFFHFFGFYGIEDFFIEFALILERHKIDTLKELEQALKGQHKPRKESEMKRNPLLIPTFLS